MKKQFVQSLQDGDVVNDYFVACRKDLRDTQSGGKFLGMVLKDKTGEVGGILWHNAAAIARQFELGDVVSVRGTVTTYQDRLQVRLDQVLPLRENEYDSSDLVFVPDDAGEIRGKFVALLETVENPWLRTLNASFTSDAKFMDEFVAAAAGKKWHHAYRGGLIEHCHEMARIALGLCDVFPALDRDVLLTAVFLHDIGKLAEMSHGMSVEYTDAGKLLGHVVIGSQWVQQKIGAIEGFPETLRLQILHCVISHHGECQHGAPIVPKTLEALVLYHCDNLDAQVSAFQRIVRECKDRGSAWSDYIQMINRQVWTKDL